MTYTYVTSIIVSSIYTQSINVNLYRGLSVEDGCQAASMLAGLKATVVADTHTEPHSLQLSCPPSRYLDDIPLLSSPL